MYKRQTESGLATKIAFFPDSNELEKIKVRIEGFKNVEDIMKLFDPKLFFVKDFTEKEEIQKCLVDAASVLYQLDNLAEEIELREEFGSTYFGNGIAILHPMHLLTDDSFIGEIIQMCIRDRYFTGYAAFTPSPPALSIYVK